MSGAQGRVPLCPVTLVPGPSLVFDDVYDNGSPSLRHVVLRNPTAAPLEVSLGGQDGVRWAQLRANVPLPSLLLWDSDGASNTVPWARADGLSPAHLRALRHMAANLETVSSLALGAGEERVLYVEVRVRELGNDRSSEKHALHATLRLATDGTQTEVPVRVTTAAPDFALESVGDGAPQRERTLVLELGDVVVGAPVAREVVVTNASALECFAQLQRPDDAEGDARDPVVSVVDAASGAPWPLVAAQPSSSAYAPVALAPHSSRRLAIELQPRASCANYEQTLTLVNLHAQAESLRILVRANILAAASDEALAVLSESPLDFGDCCGGQWTRQLLILKNTADVPLDVRFQTEKHVEATFQLAELAPARDSADEDMVGDDDVPLGGSSTTAAAHRPVEDARTPLVQAHSGPDVAPLEGSLGLGLPPLVSGVPRAGSDTTSSNASQAGSRVASPEPVHESASSEAERSVAASAPTASIAPSQDTSSLPSSGSAQREPSRLASYSVSALTSHHGRAPLRRMHDPVAMLRGAGESQHNQVEELVLRPGAQYRVVVSYRPPREEVDETYSAGRLKQLTFSIFLDYARFSDNARAHGGRQRRTILCHTRTCTPFISVNPKIVEFGMAGVGTRKTAQIAVTNHSELSTRVLMRFVSKVLSMYMDEIAIPARQTIEVKMDFFPRRVNEAYRKQITVMNLLNRHNDQIFEVRARNVDLQRVSFHSLFYRILTPSGSNYIDFGDVNIHSSRVRSFAIENLCEKRLALEMSVAHPEDLQLFVKAPQLKSVQEAHNNDEEPRRARSGTERKERFLETISTDASTLARKELVPEAKRPAKRDESRPPKPTNLVQALKRGGRGRVTYRHGAAVAFKDRTLLHPLEYLDLASGPPKDASRLSAKSRKQQRIQAQGEPERPTPPRTPRRAPTPAERLGSESRSLSRPASRAECGSPVRAKASPALTAKLRTLPLLSNPVDVAHLNLDELVAALVNQSPTLSTFFLRGLETEERLVRTEINLQRALREAIESGQLVPIGMLEVPPHAEMQVVAVYTPNGSTRPHIQGNARKQDSRIFLRLLEFDARRAASVPEFAALQARDIDELPVRDLMVRSQVCRSMLELGQPHINFGQMDKGDVRERKIWIQNRSEWALRYYIRKSGSIASGDIRLGLGRYGIVPGYGKRGVDFTFSPSLSGPFQEKLLVENIADHDNDQPVVLKASVRKVANFAIDPSSLHFGTCRAGHVSMPESVLVSNTTNKNRTFLVKVDDSLPAAVPIDVLVATSSDTATRRALSREEEEEVETLLQKLKIASRKGNADKLAKYQDRLQNLGVPIPKVDGVEDAEDTEEASMEEDVRHDYTLVWPASRADDAQTRTSLTLQLAPQQSQKLLLRVRVPRGAHASAVHIGLKIHEAKNSDETRSVAVHARIEI
ncbi:uncharacterized protein MJAP1_003587 [Malassezia japonica]|uniref:Uncharacterized protein n=1 Tax=Malassezia japonica TaxID=223818 RepID=A0AAF0F4V7_9BASI|nr:uncharacterized protein MJAP1_003587 [Malassezia japonica]WFD40599.1 hypothetical protein MJAP1_003587 [Malassezia japonica]